MTKSQTQGWIDAIKAATGAADTIEIKPIHLPPYKSGESSVLSITPFKNTELELDLFDIIADLLQLQRTKTPIPEGVTEVDLKVSQREHCIRYIKFVTTGDGASEIVEAACKASHNRRLRGQ